MFKKTKGKEGTFAPWGTFDLSDFDWKTSSERTSAAGDDQIDGVVRRYVAVDVNLKANKSFWVFNVYVKLSKKYGDLCSC